jgi:hypothetical protein
VECGGSGRVGQFGGSVTRTKLQVPLKPGKFGRKRMDGSLRVESDGNLGETSLRRGGFD